MGKIGIQIKASLTNVDRLYPHQPEQFCWPIKVKCTGCNEENDNWHLVSQDEVVDLTHTQAHFVYKCKCCNRENFLTILPSNQVNPKQKSAKNAALISTEYSSADDGKFKTIIAFECRGLDVIAFDARDGWAVESGRKTFQDVDLSEKEWVEYNDVDNVPVEINNVEFNMIGLNGLNVF